MAFRAVLVDVRSERRALLRKVIDLALYPGAVVAEALGSAGALVAIEKTQATAVVLEIQLPVAEGLAAIAELRAAHPSLVIVVCTFLADPDTKLRAFSAGADDYLVKPVSIKDLRKIASAQRLLPA